MVNLYIWLWFKGLIQCDPSRQQNAVSQRRMIHPTPSFSFFPPLSHLYSSSRYNQPPPTASTHDSSHPAPAPRSGSSHTRSAPPPKSPSSPSQRDTTSPRPCPGQPHSLRPIPTYRCRPLIAAPRMHPACCCIGARARVLGSFVQRTDIVARRGGWSSVAGNAGG